MNNDNIKRLARGFVKFKKIITAEIIIFIMVVVVALFIVELNPSLISSKKSESIPMYSEELVATQNMSLVSGQTQYAQFNYSTYEPVVLVLNVQFQNWQSSGYLTFTCNGRNAVTVFATPRNPQIKLEIVTFANSEWVKPPSKYADTFTNSVQFTSSSENGFEGYLICQIFLRGTE